MNIKKIFTIKYSLIIKSKSNLNKLRIKCITNVIYFQLYFLLYLIVDFSIYILLIFKQIANSINLLKNYVKQYEFRCFQFISNLINK